MARNAVPVLECQLHEREAFRAIFSFGGTLAGLTSEQVSGRDAAIANARALGAEIVARLKGAPKPAPRLERVA
jgi:chromosome partitioning protein